MNCPKRPRLSTIERPQFSQYSSCVVSCMSAESRSGRSMGFSLVKVQDLGSSFAYALLAKNEPCLLHFMISGESQRAHFSLMGYSILFTFFMCFMSSRMM